MNTVSILKGKFRAARDRAFTVTKHDRIRESELSVLYFGIDHEHVVR